MDATSSNVERLAGLKRLGVELALDDFGTGLLVAPVPAALPDRLAEGAEALRRRRGRGEEASSRLARAIVNLAHSLNLEVIAEGIESAARVGGPLRSSAVSRGQGFYFSPPLPEDEISARCDLERSRLQIEAMRRRASGEDWPRRLIGVVD